MLFVSWFRLPSFPSANVEPSLKMLYFALSREISSRTDPTSFCNDATKSPRSLVHDADTDGVLLWITRCGFLFPPFYIITRRPRKKIKKRTNHISLVPPCVTQKFASLITVNCKTNDEMYLSCAVLIRLGHS